MQRAAARKKRPSHKGEAKIFDNPILERLTKTHISIPLILYTIISSFLIYWGIFEKGLSQPEIIGFFFAGLFFFTFIEYIFHRYGYHVETENKKIEDAVYKMHGAHHDFPRDKKRLAMPPLLAVIIASVFFGIYRAIMGDFAFGFTAGFLMGYTAYLCIHYSVHAFNVPKNGLKILWHHHAYHHYRDNTRAFGVSSPLWDIIFGTMPLTNEKLTDQNH